MYIIQFLAFIFAVDMLYKLQSHDSLIRLSICPSSKTFETKFDDLQEKISKISLFDELLAGKDTYCSF